MAIERERTDLVLMPRQYAFSKDMTKGNLTAFVGPYRTSLSETDRLIVMDKVTGELRDARDQIEAVQSYVNIAEGEYVVLTNPPSRTEDTYPEPKKNNDVIDLSMGRRVNLPGPLSFPLWPFQTVKQIKGHQLRMNQYAVVRVINEDEARKNWDKAIVKLQKVGEGGDPKNDPKGDATGAAARKSVPRPENLSVGQLLIIRGTEISFYIPPTGLEVVPDEKGEYVREAVTLEQLEYCVLVDQSGDKRYEKGPQVVFPKPSETFKVENEDGQIHRKFKAIELTKISGLHIKVTAAYKDGKGEHKVGDEIFVTGEDQPIYFPRAEHAIIRYDGCEVHYATAVPKGEGRYVLNRFTGDVALVEGPKMLLPDPRTEVLVKRILSPRQVQLWYPGNAEALKVNTDLAAQAIKRGSGGDYLAETPDMDEERVSSSFALRRSLTPSRHVGDEMGRKTTYTPPRTVTLNTKFEGAVSVDIWTGYAVLVVDRSGKRKVVEGPQTILLGFDQSLAYMGLSTGKPKTTDRIKETAYLRVLNNLVSDAISVETSDSVQAEVKVSYRVNFLGEKNKWFDVENYVKLLCDHARSLIRNVVKKVGIQEFNAKYIDIVRGTILGQPEGPAGETTKRPRLVFGENGMVVFDVEVLGLKIGDIQISNLLIGAQHKAVLDTLQVAQNKRDLEIAKEREAISRETDEMKTTTALKKFTLQQSEVKSGPDLLLAQLEAQKLQAIQTLEVEQEQEKVKDLGHNARLAREKLTMDQTHESRKAQIALEIEKLLAESKELAARTKSVTPELIAALQAFGDKALVEKMAEAMSPMALLGGESVADILGKLLKGTGLESVVSGVAGGLASRMVTPGAGNGVGRQ